MRPVRAYQEAYYKAVDDYNRYYEKAIDNYNNENYLSCKSYLNMCLGINSRFNGNIGSRDDILSVLVMCDEQIEKQKKSSLSSNKTYGIQYETLSSNESCRITNVVLSQNYTKIEFCLTNSYKSGGWCNIDPSAHIIDKRGNSYSLLWAEGIPKSPEKYYFSRQYESLKFTLVFPSVPDSETKIDFVESENGKWKFYNIKIR